MSATQDEKSLTNHEREAVQNLMGAIQRLPKGIFFSIDEKAGRVEFWKFVSAREYTHIGELNCRGAILS